MAMVALAMSALMPLFASAFSIEESSQPCKGAPTLPPIAPTTKRLFLVRHGEVVNPGGDKPVYYGAMDVPLSPLGEAEARAAAEYLRQFQLHRVATSPLSRAIFGAAEVQATQRHLPGEEGSPSSKLMIHEGFKEMDRGEWCGLTLDEIGSDRMRRFDACDASVTPANGESYPRTRERVLRARDELLDVTDPGCASVLVSHLQVTRCIISDAEGLRTDEISKLKVATASITCIDYCGETGQQTIHFQSFKPDAGLAKAKDMAN